MMFRNKERPLHGMMYSLGEIATSLIEISKSLRELNGTLVEMKQLKKTTRK
jgi:hypothetical protein